MLADPVAFGEAGRRYALATAGMLHEAESDGASGEEGASSSGDSDGPSEEHSGDGQLPAEIQRVAQRQAGEGARQTAKRAARRRDRGKKPSGKANRQLHRPAEKARYEQTENHRARKREQNSAYYNTTRLHQPANNYYLDGVVAC